MEMPLGTRQLLFQNDLELLLPFFRFVKILFSRFSLLCEKPKEETSGNGTAPTLVQSRMFQLSAGWMDEQHYNVGFNCFLGGLVFHKR